jgi:hypothetical protein
MRTIWMRSISSHENASLMRNCAVSFAIDAFRSGPGQRLPERRGRWWCGGALCGPPRTRRRRDRLRVRTPRSQETGARALAAFTVKHKPRGFAHPGARVLRGQECMRMAHRLVAQVGHGPISRQQWCRLELWRGRGAYRRLSFGWRHHDGSKCLARQYSLCCSDWGPRCGFSRRPARAERLLRTARTQSRRPSMEFHSLKVEPVS